MFDINKLRPKILIDGEPWKIGDEPRDKAWIWTGAFNNRTPVYNRQSVRKILFLHFTKLEISDIKVYPQAGTHYADVNPFRCTMRGWACHSKATGEEAEQIEELAEILPVLKTWADYDQFGIPKHLLEQALKLKGYSPCS